MPTTKTSWPPPARSRPHQPLGADTLYSPGTTGRLSGMERLLRWQGEGGMPLAVARLGITIEQVERNQTVTWLPLTPKFRCFRAA